MITACTHNNLLCGPLEIDDTGFEALTDEQRASYGFLPCELVFGPEPGPGEQYCANGLSRRIDRVRAHFAPSSDADMITRDGELSAVCAGLEYVIYDRLSTMSIDDALTASRQDIANACEDYHDIMYPPEPEVEL